MKTFIIHPIPKLFVSYCNVKTVWAKLIPCSSLLSLVGTSVLHLGKVNSADNWWNYLATKICFTYKT